MIAIIILGSLIFAVLIVIAVFIILSHQQLMKFNLLNGAYQADEYRKASQVYKSKKETLPAKQQVQKGRSVVAADELVDIADLPWEDGLKAIEELANG